MQKTILIVDDSKSMRLFLSSTLQEANYRVMAAVDGNDALAKLDGQINLVLTDLIMPSMDGINLIKAIRGIATRKSLPIIVMTTENQTETKQLAKAAGATGWMAKPFGPQQLLAAVDKILT